MKAKVKYYPFYIAVFLLASILMLPGGCNDSNGGSGGNGGEPGNPSSTPIDAQAPLSSVMQTRLVDNNGTGAFNIPDYVKALVRLYAEDSPAPGVQFPLEVDTQDKFRQIDGLSSSVVVSWLDPLTNNDSGEAPRFGANNDYTAFLGDGWNDDWDGNVVGSAPVKPPKVGPPFKL